MVGHVGIQHFQRHNVVQVYNKHDQYGEFKFTTYYLLCPMKFDSNKYKHYTYYKISLT